MIDSSYVCKRQASCFAAQNARGRKDLNWHCDRHSNFRWDDNKA